MARGSCIAALLALTVAGGCRSTVVREHYIPTPVSAAGEVPGLTRVRMAAHGPDWSLGCMPQCGAMQAPLSALAGQQQMQALAAREVNVQQKTLLAQGVSRELDALLLAPGATTEANADARRLQAVNAICQGLGATTTFSTLAEAQAFLDRAAVLQGAPR